MKNLNIGIINHVLTGFLSESIDNNKFKSLSKELFILLESSPLLQLEYNVMNNLSNKKDKNIIVDRYIDDNIKLFESYTLNEFDLEQKKLIPLAEKYDLNINSDDNKLYDSIHNLIRESLKISNEIDVDTLHESFLIIHEHLSNKNENHNKNLNDESNVINEEVIKIAINEFNENYLSKLNESELDIFKKLIHDNFNDKVDLCESLKRECISKLDENRDVLGDEKYNLSIQKINELNNTKTTINENILKLFELKNGL